MTAAEAPPSAVAPPAVASPMLPSPYRIEKLRRETADVFTWSLCPVSDKTQPGVSTSLDHPLDKPHAVGQAILPAAAFKAALDKPGGTGLQPVNGPSGPFAPRPFAPGQFNMLYAFGCGEVPISISGDPTKPETIVHTIRAVGPVTRAMEKFQRGDVIGLRGPFGSHWPVEESAGADIVILAGGIGLAPLRPALYRVLADRHNYGKVVVLYGARTPADILFRSEVEEWRSRFDLQVEVTVDRGDRDWMGNVGVVTRLLGPAQFDASSAVALVCGPEIMMRFAIAELLDRGLPADSVYVSLERSMKCGVGLCGHCQLGPTFICKNGPVYRYDLAKPLLAVREL